jgi:hypothetical protein
MASVSPSNPHATGWKRRLSDREGKARIVAIGIFFALAWLITLCAGYRLRNSLMGAHLAESERDVFFAWLGELCFFTIIGLAITVISLEKPEDPSKKDFRDRLKILFGSSEIPDAVLSYNSKQISRLANYATVASRFIQIETYDDTLKAYRTEIATEYQIRNLLRDIPSPDVLSIGIVPDDFSATSLLEIGKVLSIEIAGKEKLEKPAPIGRNGFQTKIAIEVPPNDIVILRFKYDIWMKVGEEQRVVPQRVVETFSMRIVSRCDRNPRLRMGDVEDFTLIFAQPFAPTDVQGASPGETAFSFVLQPPV